MTGPATTFNPLALPFESSQLIEASAGTGKTYTITNLCLRLLLARNLPWDRPLAINEILILTFTIAATEELRARIARRIGEARQAYRTGEGDAFLRSLVNDSEDRLRDQKLLAAASQLMDEASIFTIHGFCARVLGEQAFESGTLFNTELNAERDHLLKTATEDCFRGWLLRLDTPVRNLALSMWASPRILAEQLSPCLFRGELAFYPAYNADVDVDRIIRHIEDIKHTWTVDNVEALIRDSKTHKRRKPWLRLDQMKALCESAAIDFNSELWDIYTPASLQAATLKNEAPPEHPVFAQIAEVPALVRQLKANLWHDVRGHVSNALVQTRQQASLLTLDDLLTTLADAVNRPGSQLPGSLAGRWPVAMIDEFQDTDSIQTSIFAPVYLEPGGPQRLLMIGDPKQAIYGFRGADIFTYINARRDVGEPHNLAVNWRSSPAMIEATNRLFAEPGLFGNEQDIPFVPVSAPEAHADMAVTVRGSAAPPYCLFVDDTAQGFSNRNDVLERLMAHAAEETVALLDDSSATRLDGEPVTAGQIAFLVRRRADAVAARRALEARGIKSVYLTLESVFLQDTAADLKLILGAIAEPGNDRLIRSALATRFMQTPAMEIDRLSSDINQQQQVTAEFRDYHQLWLDKDIAHMLSALLARRDIAARWLALPEGERQLTNFRHLSEILQQQSAITPGMHQLIKWFSNEQREAETVSVEERQLRLESDENLVKIVTMHAAKGLEYDIVMIPMPVFLLKEDRAPYLFHEEHDGNYRVAVELFDDPLHVDLHNTEERAEEMRLLYVALTRARYRCYLGLPKIKKLAGSGIARLVGADATGEDDMLAETVRDQLPADLYEVVMADGSRLTPLTAAGRRDETPVAPPGIPDIDASWQIHSYSSLAARLHHAGDAMVAGFSDDDDLADTGTAAARQTRHTFPRGARIGIALHSLMEDVDFTADRNSDLCSRTLRRLGLPDSWLEVLESWLGDILQAPLGAMTAAADSFSLCNIDQADRLDEMEFHFTVKAEPALTAFLHDRNIIQASTPVTLAGQMTGLIDLLFRRDGRYYIADYKSNHLGRHAGNYDNGSLETAMNQHQYHLQYLIYTVAVHRMLSRRMAGYDFEQHFGGVYYLFLRGMNPDDTRGIFFTRPSLELIRQLDALLEHDGDMR